MSYYNPDPAAIIAQQQDERFVTFLSQRDTSLQIPVNYVTYPGVVLTAACFAHGRYEETAAAKCFSNLLATGFRRLEADVFWDVSRSVWSLCPVELGTADGPLSTSVSEASTPFQTATQLASDLLTNNGDAKRAAPTPLRAVERQNSDVLLAPSFSTRSASTPSITTTVTLDAPLIPTSLPTYSRAPDPVTSDVTMIQAGPYSCTLGADLALLVQVLSEHLDSTETNLNASTNMLTLNIHAAASPNDPAGSAQAPSDDQMPDSGSLLSSVIASNTSVYMYTPDELESQRSDLNNSKSWFAVLPEYQPAAIYFQVDTNRGQVYTPNGWPSEAYIEMQQAKRLLVGFGEIDPQMSGYNFTGDEGLIFSQNYIDESRVVTFGSNNDIETGCFFDPNVTSLARTNNSWALTALGNGTAPTGAALTSMLLQARNLTSCGISTIINGTLNNATADENFEAYAAFVNATVWTWAPRQPVNSSASNEYSNYRCAALNATSGYWQAEDCGSSLYGACRIGDEPYRWQISDANTPYDRVDLGCEGNSSFDVPRTALENTYLLSAWRDFRSDDSDNDGGALLWLDLNDLDVTSCWVIGQNTTCPYDGPPSTSTREIAVPVVGGVIVLVLAVLTVLVKCAGNRQKSKRRRRRGDGGWDYEGVPS
ncbi:hypothetical protein M409DRAFT_21766 [Zasmidium cellare ATCC 36951]|uniref:Maintenance of telomere capping protein 6 n=1 Tax=Zasmidium cellare ATCC 36951 TaxID=1080233 RepID=A0A6A6CR78_ZASCE|nr:uncharacterized protein M409DRAFT_21766 [Zasmidium cellare ATCC 36951]KAF2168332.1 hypothetical protein M409DRAFT_21766 [Zasmidium cellare ATCC 36951]